MASRVMMTSITSATMSTMPRWRRGDGTIGVDMGGSLQIAAVADIDRGGEHPPQAPVVGSR